MTRVACAVILESFGKHEENSVTSLEATHTYREIHEQPAVIERFLRTQRDVTERLSAEIRRRGITHVVISARGTSDNAGRYATYVVGGYNRLPVALATPSLHTVYGLPPRFDGALVLGISQSGKSPDIISVLEEARSQGALTASITNATSSPLADVSDFVIDVQAGDERAIAATKSYTSQVTAVALLSAVLAQDAARLAELDRLFRRLGDFVQCHAVDRRLHEVHDVVQCARQRVDVFAVERRHERHIQLVHDRVGHLVGIMFHRTKLECGILDLPVVQDQRGKSVSSVVHHVHLLLEHVEECALFRQYSDHSS